MFSVAAPAPAPASAEPNTEPLAIPGALRAAQRVHAGNKQRHAVDLLVAHLWVLTVPRLHDGADHRSRRLKVAHCPVAAVATAPASSSMIASGDDPEIGFSIGPRAAPTDPGEERKEGH